MRDIEKLLAGANSAMREKLEENSHKGDWSEVPIRKLIHFSDIETAEIKMALYLYGGAFHPKEEIRCLGELRREVADRMNFDAMMIARCDNIIKELENAGEQKD